MFPEQHAVFLAVMLMLAGISQLIAPVAGYFSDRCTSKHGRRIPFLVGGNVVLLVMVGLLYVARSLLLGWAYLVLLFFAILALNVAYTGFTGLVSDMIPQDQMGTASGIMGGLTALGAVVGLVSLGFAFPVSHAYAIYTIALIVTTPLTYWAARDPPLDPSTVRRFDWAEVEHAYYISPSTHGDFFWVFLSRTFYYMAVSVQIYILYYLKDTMPEEIAVHAKSYTALLCILSQAASGITSVMAPSLAEVIGRKPAIYFSCCVMAFVYIGYCLSPPWDYVVVLGICYGIGNGVYISVDYALACECLPDSGSDGAKDLALWGVVAFRGMMFGPCVTGPLLAWLGHEDNSDHYAFIGYVAIMLCGVVYSVGCGLALFNVTRGGVAAK
ncbi:major facilitator superfamily domain-containing protein [Baffinella frigidus]|nr:major facilitator superfamily domain-containing protein [Cryptophyta sp. CCMP2293]